MNTTRSMVYVNAYHVNRACGVQEEGGWWYDYGEPLAAVPIALTTPYVIEDVPEDDEPWDEPIAPDMNGVNDEDCARIGIVIADLKRNLADFDDPRGIGSVLCEGVLRIHVEFRMAEAWPKRAPRYE
jgi:hypothetical protein